MKLTTLETQLKEGKYYIVRLWQGKPLGFFYIVHEDTFVHLKDDDFLAEKIIKKREDFLKALQNHELLLFSYEKNQNLYELRRIKPVLEDPCQMRIKHEVCQTYQGKNIEEMIETKKKNKILRRNI